MILNRARPSSRCGRPEEAPAVTLQLRSGLSFLCRPPIRNLARHRVSKSGKARLRIDVGPQKLWVAAQELNYSAQALRGWLKSYEKKDFADVALHYPLAPSVTALQVNDDAASSDFEGVTPNPFVTDRNSPKPLPDNGCNTVTDRTPPEGRVRVVI